jgi:glutathione peroxidase
MSTTASAATPPCSPLLDVEVRRLAGEEVVNLCEAYQGKVVLIVNTASKCGFTSQYEGLEALYEQVQGPRTRRAGLPVQRLREPGAGERGRDREVLPPDLLGRISDVREGQRQERGGIPALRAPGRAGAPYPKWNFYKYLIDREGKLVDHYVSFTKPDDRKIVKAIEKLL